MPHSLNDLGTPKDLALHRMDVAKEDLETAESNYSGNHLRAANNRAYYAIYHAITAVLAIESVAFKKHKDTIAHFNKFYVKTTVKIMSCRLFVGIKRSIDRVRNRNVLSSCQKWTVAHM